jgi:hypothetical protein
MSAPKIVPRWQDIGKEALIVIGGAIVAALIISQMPGVKAWINKQWGDTPKGI